MDVGKIDEMVSRAISQLERAKLRLVMSLDICYPGMVNETKRREIIDVNMDLAMAHNEIQMAEHLTMEVIKKWANVTDKET